MKKPVRMTHMCPILPSISHHTAWGQGRKHGSSPLRWHAWVRSGRDLPSWADTASISQTKNDNAWGVLEDLPRGFSVLLSRRVVFTLPTADLFSSENMLSLLEGQETSEGLMKSLDRCFEYKGLTMENTGSSRCTFVMFTWLNSYTLCARHGLA